MIIEKIMIAEKYLASFFKRKWTIADYPLRVKRQRIDSNYNYGRFKPVPWTVQIVNWWTMQGYGNTKDEAMEDLKIKFEKSKYIGVALMRPGVKMHIEFASNDYMEKHKAMAEDFFKNIIGYDINNCLVSDESSLYDFHSEDNNDLMNAKILKLYGVDVSDIKNGFISEILKRIEK